MVVSRLGLVAAALALAVCRAEDLKKGGFVITDAKGVAGIYRQEQADPANPELRQALTAEVNAAVLQAELAVVKQGLRYRGEDFLETWTRSQLY